MSRLNEGEILKGLNMKRETKYFKSDWCLFQRYWVLFADIGFTRMLRKYFALLSIKKKAFDPEFEMKVLKRPAFSDLS